MHEGPDETLGKDKVLLKMAKMIKDLAKQMNEQYIDLSKRMKKVEDEVVSTGKETIKEIKPLKDSMKTFDYDIKNLYNLVKNIETSLVNENDEYKSLGGDEADDVEDVSSK